MGRQEDRSPSEEGDHTERAETRIRDGAFDSGPGKRRAQRFRARHRPARGVTAAAPAAFLSAVVCAASASAGPSTLPNSPTELPRAEIIKPLGVDPALLEGAPDDTVRVAILLARQPVLEVTTRPGFEASLSGYTRGDVQQAARHSPDGISDLEASAARRSERRRTTVVSKLRDEVAEIEAAKTPVEGAVERHGGNVAENDLAATGALALVSARLNRDELNELADRDDIQAIVAAPKPRPQLDTSTTTIDAA